jgi:hypothetical protein
VFDSVVCHDGGADHVIGYGGVHPHNVGAMVDGAIFTRAPKDKKNTAIFIGGSNMAEGEALFKAVKKKFFSNFRVSVMLDSNGSNTTAAACVAWLAHKGSLKGKKVVILGGTGPVGTRAAVMLASEGATVTLVSRKLATAEDAAKQLKATFDLDVGVAEAADCDARGRAIEGANVVIATGAGRHPAAGRAPLEGQPHDRTDGRCQRDAAAGHRRHRHDGQGREQARQDRVRCDRFRRTEDRAAARLRGQAVRKQRCLAGREEIYALAKTMVG